MKKIIALSLSTLMALSILGGCSSKDAEEMVPDTNTPSTENNTQTYQDGTYKAELRESYRGYKDYVELTIRNGKIENVMYDGKNETGGLLTEDEEIRNTYETQYNTYPQKFFGMYANELMTNQTIDMVNLIPGTENDYEIFKKLVNAALMNAKTGEKSTALVDINL